MPTDSLLLSIAVCGVFLGFAAILAIIDHRTTQWQRSKSSSNNTAPAAEQRRKEAA